MNDPVPQALNPPADCLLVFADETGDPAYRDPANPVFGLGGCTVIARDVDRLIRNPWSSVRTALGRGATARLHAKQAERRMTEAKQKVLRAFFIEQPFGRVAYISSLQTKYSGKLDDAVVRSTSLAFLQRVVAVAKWQPFSSITVIFEDNPHLISRFERALAGAQLEEDGRVIPLEWYVMPKSAGEPSLEVADFMMHTVAGYIRSGRDPQGKFAARFSAVFGTKNEKLCSFMEGSAISYEATPHEPR
jgi:hypothetical protein